MALLDFAKQELAVLRGPSPEPDEMQDAIEADVLKIVEIFASQGHSGSSAAYTIGILEKLLKYEPLTPLRGTEDEWFVHDHDGECYAQNKRCSRVFKRRDGTAYDIEAVIFQDPDGSHWCNGDSRRDITFPYTPTTMVVKREV